MAEVSTTSFHELIRTHPTPVLVDFWAEWCGPCKVIAPVLKEIARAYASRLTVVKVNVDEKPHIAQEYGIQGIPTLILFKNGSVAWRVSGALPYEQLDRELRQRL